MLLVDRRVGVDVVVGALLEVVLAEHAGDIEDGLLPLGERVDADQLDDLLEFGLLLERLDRLLPERHPVGGDLGPHHGSRSAA